jgi:hypothetical protein
MWDGKKDPPAVLTLKRKAIRMFPDGRKIALYFSDVMEKYISIPYGGDEIIPVTEEITVEEEQIKTPVSPACSTPEKVRAKALREMLPKKAKGIPSGK